MIGRHADRGTSIRQRRAEAGCEMLHDKIAEVFENGKVFVRRDD